jgi:membrane protease YdiL (CAAX protease family)
LLSSFSLSFVIRAFRVIRGFLCGCNERIGKIAFRIFESVRDARRIRQEEPTAQSSSVMSSTEIPFPSASPLASRALSAFELLLGGFIVIGHNVFHIVPNEVIVLFVLGMVSIRLRNGGWSAMGFKRPASWRRIFVIAVAAAALRILLGQFVIEPVTGHFWPAPIAPALANEIAGNVKVAFLAVLLVWTFAAFGEEIAYRGYLLTRAAEIGKRSTTAYWVGIVFVSILFGYGHYYKGTSGIVDSGFAGLILGAAYMLADRNLWACIFTHGFVDTCGVINAFFGWSK